MGYSDAELIRGIRNKDDRALKYLYVSHYNMVRHFVLNNNGNEDDAKDLYQEVIIMFYEKTLSGKLELTCQIKTFLYAVCRRQWLKKLVQQSKFIGKIEESETLAEISDDEFVDLDERENNIQNMQNAMLKLGEPCATIIRDYYLHSASMQEICDKMGYTNADNVKNQKYKCLVRLKKIFFIKR